MIVGWIIVLSVALVDWIAVAKGWKKVEIVAKPWTMGVLSLLLVPSLLRTSFASLPLLLLGAGLLFSLAGDVFLLVSHARFSNRWFLLGLLVFLLAHVTYIVALNIPFGAASPFWSMLIGVFLAVSAGRILRRILAGVRARGVPRLLTPVAVYGMVITLMLLSAILTLSRTDWSPSASGLVSLGALLFFFSDLLLAWNRYVKPVSNGRLVNMITYHLGQMALVAGMILQFGK
jgi:uncharacterized membrane protein YhhN